MFPTPLFPFPLSDSIPSQAVKNAENQKSPRRNRCENKKLTAIITEGSERNEFLFFILHQVFFFKRCRFDRPAEIETLHDVAVF